MRSSAVKTLMGVLLLTYISVSAKGESPVDSKLTASSKTEGSMTETLIEIRIGAKSFTATLADNPTAMAFKALLPLTLEMSDLHENEKFCHLPSRLQSNDANPGLIQTGDLMLWSSKSVVLFYKTFPTPYSYTKLGRVNNPEGLSAAVGTGDVIIKIELSRR